MLKLKQLILLVALLSGNFLYTNPAFALPKNIQLEYEVSRNGKRFATLKEVFTQNGKQYSVKSVTKGIGIYALLGERVLSSAGTVTKDGLKPAHFELHQGKGDKKTLISDFNWAKNTLSMQSKDGVKTDSLSKGTQDLSSYAYQFMYNPPTKPEVSMTLTTGKKLRTYRYKVIARNVPIEAAGANYKTVQISNEAGAGDDKKQLWLAQDQYYLPIRYEIVDDEGVNFEQILTKIHVE